jgi:hypothetical protein
MRTPPAESWVVYQTSNKQGMLLNVVCQQREWDAMEASRPGQHTLVRSGILNEAEAELLARGKTGDPVPRVARAAK